MQVGEKMKMVSHGDECIEFTLSEHVAGTYLHTTSNTYTHTETARWSGVATPVTGSLSFPPTSHFLYFGGHRTSSHFCVDSRMRLQQQQQQQGVAFLGIPAVCCPTAHAGTHAHTTGKVSKRNYINKKKNAFLTRTSSGKYPLNCNWNCQQISIRTPKMRLRSVAVHRAAFELPPLLA